MRARLYDLLIVPMTASWYGAVLERLPRGAHLLDVGIGTGGALLAHSGRLRARDLHVTGVDIDADYVTRCRGEATRHGVADRVDARLESVYDHRGGPYDAAYFSGSFMLLPDPPSAVRRVAAQLAPGGRIYFTQTFEHERSPVLEFVKPMLRRLTTVDFGRVTYEAEFLDALRRAGAACEERVVLEAGRRRSALLMVVRAGGAPDAIGPARLDSARPSLDATGMGLEVERDVFSEAEFASFGRRLAQSLGVLDEVLRRPAFGVGPPTVGAELELCLVDHRGHALPYNRAVLDSVRHPRVTLETDRFNLECNTAPVALAGRPFSALRADLDGVLAAVRDGAARYGGHIVAIGILPTLRAADLTAEALTRSARYRALSNGLRRLRRRAFEIAIDGPEPLVTRCDDVTFEGANTSWQVHLKVEPARFAAAYNAAQIAIAPVLAVAGNSPTFLGHRLWDETRVALYRQSVDERIDAAEDDWRPGRVSFGHGWVRRGAAELFAESVAIHAPLLAAVSDEDPVAVAAAGGVPRLDELRLHHGTVWRWNRAVYDAADGGHLRIEFRALPAGPSVTDMLANAAFLLGLTLALAPAADALVTRLTFGQARRNFYAAGRDGVDAELLWPCDEAPSPRRYRATALVPRLLPLARTGLVDAGVAPDEVDELLAVIEARAASRQTGARWQADMLRAASPGLDRPAALDAMLARYRELAAGGEPVHRWPRPSPVDRPRT